MGVALQGSLLDGLFDDPGTSVLGRTSGAAGTCEGPGGRSEPGPALGRLGDAVHRTVLSRGAWVDHRPSWVTGSDVLFQRLVDVVPWRAERRRMYEREVDVPRLLCFYDEGVPWPDPLL